MAVKSGFAIGLGLLIVTALLAGGAGAVPPVPSPIPPPEKTPVEVVVSGRTSTLKNITIVNVGQQIPKTFSRDLLHNTPGFSWYVSRHFALKTDFPEAQAREYVTLLELAYPHYVACFGREIPEMRDRRMAFIYGSSYEQLQLAARSDDMYSFGGGGIAQEGFWCTYQFPSNEYHSRYILLHEGTHLYQYCLAGTTTNTPGFYVEGIADGFSSHVYDPKHQRLTVDVLDRAPVHNFFEYGMNDFKGRPDLTFEKLHQQGGGDRGTNVLMTQFLKHTPERLQKWRIYQDEMIRTAEPATKQKVSERLLTDLYGPWERINADFAEWMKARTPTFHQVNWGFDQYGDAMVSFGQPRGSGDFSEMDIALAPEDPPRPDDMVMDYPAEPVPPIVGPVKRGVAEPSVGCIVDFSCEPGKGVAGLGLGRIDRNGLRVLVDEGKRLVMDGADLGMNKTAMAIPEPLQAAMKKDGHRVGITVKIAAKAVEVTLRAGPKGKQALTASVAINEEQRRRLMAMPMAVLGAGARHLITPVLDDGRPPAPNLMVPASPDRWRNPSDPALYRAYKACWRLGPQAPKVLLEVRDNLLAAAAQSHQAQEDALRTYEKALPDIVKAVHACGAPPETISLALVELSGLSLNVLLEDGPKASQCTALAFLSGLFNGSASGKVRFECGPPSATRSVLKAESVEIKTGKTSEVRRVVDRPKESVPFYVEATADLAWFGVPMTLSAMKVGNAGIPGFWMVGPFDSGGKFEDVPHDIEKGPVNLTNTYPAMNHKMVTWQKIERDPAMSVDLNHLVYLVRHFGQANGAFAYALVWVDAARDTDAVLAVGASDGLAVWVNDEKVHSVVGGRDWSPQEDRIPIHLKQGRNRLLLKSMHGGGLWFLSADIQDEKGKPIDGVTTTLQNEEVKNEK